MLSLVRMAWRECHLGVAQTAWRSQAIRSLPKLHRIMPLGLGPSGRGSHTKGLVRMAWIWQTIWACPKQSRFFFFFCIIICLHIFFKIHVWKTWLVKVQRKEKLYMSCYLFVAFFNVLAREIRVRLNYLFLPQKRKFLLKI